MGSFKKNREVLLEPYVYAAHSSIMSTLRKQAKVRTTWKNTFWTNML